MYVDTIQMHKSNLIYIYLYIYIYLFILLHFLPIECSLEYKINEAAAELLHMQGIMKTEDLEKYKDDVAELQKLEMMTSLPEKHKYIRRSRSSDQGQDRPCCCAPTKHMVPTFITDDKFDDILETFSKNNN